MRSTLLTVTALVSLAAFSAMAAENSTLVDSNGQPVKDGSGKCVETQFNGKGCNAPAKDATAKPVKAKHTVHKKKHVAKKTTTTTTPDAAGTTPAK